MIDEWKISGRLFSDILQRRMACSVSKCDGKMHAFYDVKIALLRAIGQFPKNTYSTGSF